MSQKLLVIGVCECQGLDGVSWSYQGQLRVSLVIHLWAGGARRVQLKAVYLWVSTSLLITRGRDSFPHAWAVLDYDDRCSW